MFIFQNTMMNISMVSIKTTYVGIIDLYLYCNKTILNCNMIHFIYFQNVTGHLDGNKKDNDVTNGLEENFWIDNIFFCYIIDG